MTIVALLGLVGVLVFLSDNRAEAENIGDRQCRAALQAATCSRQESGDHGERHRPCRKRYAASTLARSAKVAALSVKDAAMHIKDTAQSVHPEDLKPARGLPVQPDRMRSKSP